MNNVIRCSVLSLLMAAAFALFSEPTMAQTPSVCDRTAQVRSAILSKFPSGTACGDVTETQLNAITGSLDLSGKNITRLKGSDFNDLSSITKINLGGNRLTGLPSDIFKEVSSLRTLELFSNDITALNANVFDDLNTLRVLSLANNEIATLPAGIFSDLTALRELNLDGNEIATLPAGIFSGLTALRDLSLYANEIATLPAGIFSGLTALRDLSLANNEITTLPAGIFSALTSLERLNLQSNELTSLDSNVLNNLSALDDLNLRHNNLSEIPDNLFTGTSGIDKINLKHNPGAPFVFVLNLQRTDNTDLTASGPATVSASMDKGAPFGFSVELTAQGATLSANSPTFSAGGASTGTVTVTQSGTGAATVQLDSAPNVPSGHLGYSLRTGHPLVLFDDMPVSLSVSPSGLTEGARNEAVTVTASLVGGGTLSDDVDVSVTVGRVGDSATRGTDFSGTQSLTITIPAGSADSSGVATLTVTDDNRRDGDEFITFTGTTSGSTVYPATLEIRDNDVLNAVNLEFNPSRIAENSSSVSVGYRIFTVAYSGASVSFDEDTDVLVTLSASSRYDHVPPFTVTLPAGQQEVSGSFTLTVNDNNMDDGNKFVSGTIRYEGLTFAASGVTITDDDGAPTGITLSAAPGSVVEGAGATSVSVTATVGGGTTYSEEKTLTVAVGSGTATEGTDFATVEDFTITVAAGSSTASGTFTLTPTQDTVDEADESVSISASASGITVTSASVTITDDDEYPEVEISFTSSIYELEEGGEARHVVVRLDKKPEREVTVQLDVKTSEGVEKSDHSGVPELLIFDPMEKERSFPILAHTDDDIEDDEKITLSLVPLSDRVNLGRLPKTTISLRDKTLLRNRNHVLKFALAQLGRTIATNAVELLDERYSAGRGSLQLRLGGQRVPQNIFIRDGAETILSYDDGLTDFTDNRLRADDRHHDGNRELTIKELLSTTSFWFSPQKNAEKANTSSGVWTLWGRGDMSRFSGNQNEKLSTNGNVFTGYVGADYRWNGGSMAGTWLSRVSSDIDYSDEGEDGKLNLALTNVHPYFLWAPRPELAVWSIFGLGRGKITLEDAYGTETTGLEMQMLALGGQMDLATMAEIEIALKADVFHVEMASETGEDLLMVESEMQRLRIGVKGRGKFLIGDTILTPSLEIGMRYDDGKAETGAGADMGGGFALDSRNGLSFSLHARGLVAHEVAGFQEWGTSGTLSYELNPSSERGLSLLLRSGYGASVTGGADALWNRVTLDGFAAKSNGNMGSHMEVEVGYGFSALGDRFTSTPWAEFGRTETGRDWRLGWWFSPAGHHAPDVSFGIEAERREDINNNTHSLMLTLDARF